MRLLPALALAGLLLRAAPASADCDPNAPPDCSCGKLPVCVFSGHPDGMFSGLHAKSDDPNAWQGFGAPQELSDFLAAVQAEDALARALGAASPCLEIIPMDSYVARADAATAEGQQSGLPDRMRQAAESGDADAIARVTPEVDALFEKWGVGDLPWRNPDLAGAHLGGRLASCVSAVRLTGSAKDGRYTLSADTTVPAGAGMPDTASSATGSTPEGGLQELAASVAGPLVRAHQKLFGTCEETVGHCTTESFELSNQTHRCDYTTSCNHEVIRTWTERGKGLGMGMTIKREQKCCSMLARARSGELDAEDAGLADEIWCPGTWTLWGSDLDCDGVPNAKDDTPWPAEPDAPTPAP